MRSKYRSICLGALILASVGLLEGCDVTTHWAYTHFLKNLGAHYVQQRWTASGNIVNAAGVSAGIDMALYMVSRLSDEETARKVSRMRHRPVAQRSRGTTPPAGSRHDAIGVHTR